MRRQDDAFAMLATVEFQGERLEFDLREDQLVGQWDGPAGMTGDVELEAVRSALEQPLQFPPVRQAVVPGDRIAIAIDPAISPIGSSIGLLVDLLRASGVETGDITVVIPPGHRFGPDERLPTGIALEVHDPADRHKLAYLAASTEGRRIYLNRRVTDADVVIPVGRLGFDPILGYRGPWSLIFPQLSNQETLAAYRQALASDPPKRSAPRSSLDEAFEVSWLLGTQYHLGLVPGRDGLARAIGGLAESVRDEAIQAINGLWCYRPAAPAECVVVGIGSLYDPAGIDDMVEGLVTASRLVTPGGKIVALSRAQGIIGPSLQRLCDVDDPKNAPAALRGHDSDTDSIAGRRLAHVLARADVYLHSGIDRQVVEDLGMVPIEARNDANRIVSRSSSCLLVSHAELTRATVAGDATQ